MLRLAPSRPPLWRTASSVQLGPDDGRPLEGLSPWQERLLDELVTGIPDARFLPLARELGASEEEAAAFLDRIRGALGTAPERDLDVRVELPVDLAGDEEATLIAGLGAGGIRPRGIARWAVDTAADRTPVIVVAHRLVAPHRTARLLADDVPHLPVELSGDRVSVGPLVIAGQTACMACLHAARRDLDPEWPLVASQLLARPAPRTDPLLMLEAAVLAARMLRTGDAGRSVGLSAGDARRVWRAHRPHERCLCRSPEGSGMAGVPERPMPATTTVRAFARPA